MTRRQKRALALVALLCAALSPGLALAQQKNKIVLEYDDQERLARRKTDTNGDGVFDETVFYENDVPKRAESDTDYDGKIDLWISYDVAGKSIAHERAGGRSDHPVSLRRAR